MKPILFNQAMVKAIRDGRKTETRRPINPRYKEDEYGFQVCTNKATGEQWVEKYDDDEGGFDNPRYINPQYQPGDILYVRETCYLYGSWIKNGKTKTGKQKWRFVWDRSVQPKYLDNPPEKVCTKKDEVGYFKRPSIHMPKEAARTFLRDTNVNVERVQDITEDGAMAEGIRGWTKDGELYKYGLVEPGDVGSVPWREMPRSAVDAFSALWDDIYKNWSENPWVWVYKFERCQKDGAPWIK